MSLQFSKHYTREEAQALLPQVRDWLDRLNELRDRVEEVDKRLSQALGLGDDLGGEMVNSWIRHLAEMKELLQKFHYREIQIKDLSRGLIDFPAFVGGKEVFLCWEKDEEDIEFWHDLSSGYQGREPLDT